MNNLNIEITTTLFWNEENNIESENENDNNIKEEIRIESDLNGFTSKDIEEAKKFKEDYMLNLYMETSAKTGFNAKEIFIEAAKVLYKEYNKYKKIDEEKKIKLPKLSEQNPNDVIEKKKCNC